MMPGLILWKNQEMNRLKRDIDRLFDRLWDDFRIPFYPEGAEKRPFIDLSESKESLTITAELPGIHPDDLDISITDNILTIKGEIKRESDNETENYHRVERSYGIFSRSLKLPCKVRMEEVTASFEKGILQIVMPKCEPEECREIKVNVK